MERAYDGHMVHLVAVIFCGRHGIQCRPLLINRQIHDITG